MATPWGVGTAVGITVLTIGVTLVGGLFGGLLSAVVTRAGFDASAAAAVLGIVLTLSYAVLLLVVWGAARASGHTLSSAVGLGPSSVRSAMLIGLSVAVGARVIAGVYGIVLERLGVELPGQNMDPTQLLPESPVGVFFTVLLAIVIAPLVEEIVFRGVLLSALAQRWGTAVGVGVSSAVFALVHVLPFAIPPIFVLSLVLGWVFVRTRSLWPCVAAHALFNAFGVLALYALRASGAL
jgi:membrane protease YdiL (CAAX protease family)